eukprot:CAMPEP_0178420424 /NCGR_PEP_ID=MMETSP0689_2-20121128/26122_1 /TAXON_ID=160604 /ORGANISM="Amphidinium massartii, Strain CS-259" /LENGTH=153 /DNA_ID=CAMNT_0020041899 /DNA_START=256 /DNA_END=713 /DNA_ORIENTATION=-
MALSGAAWVLLRREDMALVPTAVRTRGLDASIGLRGQRNCSSDALVKGGPQTSVNKLRLCGEERLATLLACKVAMLGQELPSRVWSCLLVRGALVEHTSLLRCQADWSLASVAWTRRQGYLLLQERRGCWVLLHHEHIRSAGKDQSLLELCCG